jgi:hypothetical protein
LKENQRTQFNEQLQNLKLHECVILFDYTTFHETSVFKLHDLDTVIYTKDANGNLHHEFFHFFSEAPHDFKFTYEALERLGRTENFTYFEDGVHF